MSLRDYIEIKPKMTVNKEADIASGTTPHNSFSSLVNYIPRRGCVETRKGISSLSHTPDTTGEPVVPYDPSTDPNVIIWTKFDTTATLYDDEIQGASWWQATAGNTYSASASRKEGTGSFYSDYYTLPGAGLNQSVNKPYSAMESISFPGFVAGTHNYLMCIWYRPTYLPADSAGVSFEISRNDNTQPGGFFFRAESGVLPNYRIHSFITNAAGGGNSLTSSITLVQGRWYHLSFWCSETVGNSGMVVYDQANDTEESQVFAPAALHQGTYSAGATTGYEFKISTTTRCGRGHLDDFIVVNETFATQADVLIKIGKIRNYNRTTLVGNIFTADSDLVALWKMDDGTNFTDSSGNGNTMSGSASTPYHCAEGVSCVQFSAAGTQKATITDGNLSAGFPGKNGVAEKDFSICLWARPASIGVSTRGIITKWDSTTNTRSWAVSLNVIGQPRFQIGYTNGTLAYSVTANATLSLETWYHIGCTYDATTKGMVLRVHHEDGTLIGNYTGTVPGAMASTTYQVNAGLINTAATNHYDGKLDEVVIINRKLTTTDIDNIFSGRFGR